MTTSGVGAAGAPLLPLRSSGRVDLEGAMVVRPVAPVPPTVDPLLPDLSRAGVDLPALLDRGADALVTRAAPSSVALAELLERARGALVRGAPMEVLSALDAGWDGAARTESGWYFRAAALTLLGLPGEAERVLQQASSVRDGSPALAFLRSVVRSAAGHTAEARAALADAMMRRPGEPLLRAWDAVLSARSGHVASAQAVLSALERSGHTEPVMAWARQAVVRVHASEQRATRVANPAASFSTPSPPGTPPLAPEPVSATSRPLLDPVDAALRDLGARLGASSRTALEAEVRQLLPVLSASGALQESGRSGRSHAVRAVLATLLQLLGRAEPDPGGGGFPVRGSAQAGTGQPRPPLGRALDAYADAEGSWRLTPVGGRGVAPDVFASPVADAPTLRHAVLDALRAGRLAEAGQWLEQARAREGEPVVRVLLQLLEGAAGSDRAAVGGTGREPIPMVSGTASRDDTLLAPLRLGLVLLQELSPRCEARGVRALPSLEGERSARALAREGATAPSARQVRRTVAVGALLLAVIALVMGNGPVAVLLTGGAVWLLLR